MNISIITPSFNQGRFIERTINSVFSQNIHNLEYIVVDNQSQDETLSVLNRYAKDLDFLSEPDHGQAHAVNKGLRLVSGEIIGWLNSDDIYYPEALNTVANFFLNHPHIDILYGDANHVDENDNVIAPYPTESWNIKRLTKTCYLSQPAVFFRRRLLSRVGYLDEALHYCMDYEFWLRSALTGISFAYLPKILAGSRFYPTTKTCAAPLKATSETLVMLKKTIGYVPTTWLINYAVLLVKESNTKTWSLRAYAMTCHYAFTWNGFLKSLQSCVELPFILLKKFFIRDNRR